MGVFLLLTIMLLRNNLDLTGKPIKLIRSNAFSELKAMKSLDLQGLSIENIESDAFNGMERLSFLSIHTNKLTVFITELLLAYQLCNALNCKIIM